MRLAVLAAVVLAAFTPGCRLLGISGDNSHNLCTLGCENIGYYCRDIHEDFRQLYTLILSEDYRGAVALCPTLESRYPGTPLAIYAGEFRRLMSSPDISKALPRWDEWEEMRAGMPRQEQIAFLCDRLCLWQVETGVIDMTFGTSQGLPVRIPGQIDPYYELIGMQDVVPRELSLFLPYLEREAFWIKWDGWICHSQWPILIPVPWLISQIIDEHSPRPFFEGWGPALFNRPNRGELVSLKIAEINEYIQDNAE